MGFGLLRVINEDRVVPGGGFTTHSHRDMEILSWVLEGELEHKDSVGSNTRIRPGELQRMSAGTGVHHSEFNASNATPVHFLQIWLIPEHKGLTPSYQQRAFAPSDLHNAWRLVASRSGAQDSVVVHQDIELFVSRTDSTHELTHTLRPQRRGWLQISRGTVVIDEQMLTAGDALYWKDENAMNLRATEDCECLLFDLPA